MVERASRIRIREIADDLDVLRVGDADVMNRLVVAARELFDTDSVMMYSVREHWPQGVEGARWELERWHQSGGGLDIERLMHKLLAADATPFPYDPARPLLAHRNRVIEANAWIDRENAGTWTRSQLGRVAARAGLARHYQPRVLICDGPSMLGWFGTYVDCTPPRRLFRTMSALIPALHRRLKIERRLESAPRTQSALIAALERIGSAAFVVGRRGRIHEANAAGRAALDSGTEVARAIFDALAGRPSEPAFELVPIIDRGTPASYLAIVRTSASDARTMQAVRACSARWRLSPRRTQVLELVVRGLANATIAAMLGIGTRAVELHVTALLDRAGVDSRAALTARVLAG